MAIPDLLRYGNELEMSGIVMASGTERHTILFPDAESDMPNRTVIKLSHEGWKELLYQLDTLGVEGLNKIILRKSQRQIEQDVSWRVFRRDNYTCRYCADNNTPLTVDHLVRWELMGASIEDNLLSACKKCNKTRGNMEVPQWLNNEYYKKVISNFDNKVNLLYDSAQQAHLANLAQWTLAQAVPLRNTKRSR